MGFFLQEFEFEIEYKKGATHSNADVLSRTVLINKTRKRDNDHGEKNEKTEDPWDNQALINFLQNGS